MTRQRGMSRIGWLAVLGTCCALYLLLHVKVNAVHSEVVQAERRIVALESANLLLETEFLTRTNQVQLAAWNRVDFGFQSPQADQFIDSERQLASFGMPRGADAPPPIRLAGLRSGEDVPDYPRLVSPLTGEPIEADLLGEGQAAESDEGVAIAQGPLRLPIAGAVSVEVAQR